MKKLLLAMVASMLLVGLYAAHRNRGVERAHHHQYECQN